MNIRFFAFPQQREYLRQKWLDACGIREEDLPKRPLVCSLHFLTEHFHLSGKRTYLCKSAIPQEDPPQIQPVAKKQCLSKASFPKKGLQTVQKGHSSKLDIPQNVTSQVRQMTVEFKKEASVDIDLEGECDSQQVLKGDKNTLLSSITIPQNNIPQASQLLEEVQMVEGADNCTEIDSATGSSATCVVSATRKLVNGTSTATQTPVNFDDTLMELTELREEVKHLQEENAVLRLELLRERKDICFSVQHNKMLEY